MKDLKELFLDDIFMVCLSLVILGICAVLVMPPELSEKVLIGVSSGLAGIAKGKAG